MRHGLASLALLFLGSIAACAAPTSASDDDASDPAGSEDEVVAAKKQCSSADYEAAFLRYKAAVDHAKARAHGDVCGDGTMLFDIANDLGAATARCGQFENVVATSRWATPVRDALKGNLALPILTGKLRVGDRFAGMSDALPGSTIYGPAPGAYGNMSKITFAAGGKATFSALEFDGEGMPKWKDSAATWSVGAARGGAIDVTITIGAKSTVYQVTAPKNDAPYDHVPALLFHPKAGGDDFGSMPSECEA